MTKQELIDILATETGTSKAQANRTFETIFANIVGALDKKGRFVVPGFGTFKVRTRKARQSYNPTTKAMMTLPAGKTVAFRPAPSLKKEV